jgi:hypothetical protein
MAHPATTATTGRGGRAPAEALSEMDLSLRSQPGLRDPEQDVADASWPWVIGRCGSSAGAARRYRRHQRMGHHPYRGLGASADPLAGAQVRGELAGAGMTGAQRRGRDDYAPAGVEVDPHRRARVGWARSARQVDGPRFAAQGPDWQPGCGLAQDPDSKPVGDAHPIRRANDRHRSSRRAHPGPRAPRFVSRRPDRPLPCQGRVDTGNASGSTAALSTTG